MTHFVVILPYATAEMQNLVSANFGKSGFGYWHWCVDCWLVVSNDDALDAAGLRDLVLQFVLPTISFLVLRVELPQQGANWAYNGDMGQAGSWNEWLQQLWEYKAQFVWPSGLPSAPNFRLK